MLGKIMCQNVKTQFVSDGQNSFPSLSAGGKLTKDELVQIKNDQNYNYVASMCDPGSFDSSSFGKPTSRPGARPTSRPGARPTPVAVTPFTAFPKWDLAHPQPPPFLRVAAAGPKRPTPRRALTTTRRQKIMLKTTSQSMFQINVIPHSLTMKDQAQPSPADPGGCNSKAGTNIEKENNDNCSSNQTANCQVRLKHIW